MDNKESFKTEFDIFKSKVSNFFYHYKWHTIFASFFVVVISIMVFQMCSSESSDLKIMYAGPEVLADTESAAVEKAIMDIGNVYLEEKMDKVTLYELTIMNDEELREVYDDYGGSINPDMLRKNREIFAHQALSDEYFLLFLSPECYQIYKNNECLVPLSSMGITAETVLPQQAYDQYSFKLTSLDAAKFYTALGVFPEDTLVCVKRINKLNPGNGEEVQKEHITVFKKMIMFKLPDDFVAQTPANPEGNQ